MKKVLFVALPLIALAACAPAATGTTPSPTPTVTVTKVAPPTAGPTAPAPPEVEASSGISTPDLALPEDSTAPNMIGSNYQVAQDAWRAAGFTVLPAIDGTGAGRLPVIDANWIVTDQVVANGTVTATVVKYSDSTKADTAAFNAPTATDPEVASSGATVANPDMGTCKAAKAAGYGPYTSGQPEYAYYRDADGDGIVCE